MERVWSAMNLCKCRREVLAQHGSMDVDDAQGYLAVCVKMAREAPQQQQAVRQGCMVLGCISAFERGGSWR